MDSSTTSVVSPFLEAAYEGDINRMKDLLSSNSDLSVNVQDYDKRTPLHLAAAGGHMDAVQYLLDEGAQLKTDRFGMLPIHDAVVNQHNDIKEVLSQLDLKCDGGVCYLSPENEEALKEQVKNTNISLTPEDLETKMTQVFSIIIKEGVLAAGSLWQEIVYYFAELGLHPSYFKHFTSAQIARHLHCLIAAKKVAQATQSDYIHFEIEDADSAFYLTTMEPEKIAITDAKVAEYINTAQDCGFSITFLKSEKPPMPEGKFPLGVFVVDKQQFDSSVKFEEMMDETDLHLVATPRFLQERSVEVQKLYQTLIDETMATRNTVVKVFDAPTNLAQKSGAQVLQLAAFDVDRKGKCLHL
ncbi:ankyrin repeat small protein, putative [Perkinsus marinus ATCC 50983]|uniref:Ankyrin repeat small protein, putative n=1 Tax=Perkinsus marinus (strain ATCC 50983 / TXsc) TaxID=423536 RepID=C5KY90_PERM5|nr:ankyrin repeat small protein, putative [Perkinsus marinus ATCC 50983]EER10558.1 ankyrin repeat small protein, putative [Perkinsus marinus ATCC 50983]|eukprot:XP_002778763.1 ankyrin repeat small protein, putative [Perkinsus marinus ATCC 50983]